MKKETIEPSEYYEENIDCETRIRNGDHPDLKDRVMSQLFGEFIGFLKAKGLTDNEEYATQTVDIAFGECKKRVIWIDEVNPNWQLVVYLNSHMMFVEMGLCKRKDGKATKEVVLRRKIEDLRYNISPGTELCLIDSHQKKFDELFDEFKREFAKLKKNC